jgi:hypothetical protein
MRAALAGLCALAVAGCATATQPPVPILTIPVAAVLREPCPRPDFLAVETVGELAAFSVRQEGALAVCEARRGAAVAVIDAANAMNAQMAERLRPRAWWRIF